MIAVATDSQTEDTSGVHVWLVIWKAYAALSKHALRQIETLGLGFSEFGVLEVLLAKGPQPVNVIGPKVGLTSGSISVAVDRLAARGLVRRSENAADRRVCLVELTGEGRAVIVPGFAAHREAMETASASLTAAERDTLLRLLKTLGKGAAAQWQAKEVSATKTLKKRAGTSGQKQASGDPGSLTPVPPPAVAVPPPLEPEMTTRPFELAGRFGGFVFTDAGKRRLRLREGDGDRLLKVPRSLRRQVIGKFREGDLVRVVGTEKKDAGTGTWKQEVSQVLPGAGEPGVAASPPGLASAAVVSVCAKKNCWRKGGRELWDALGRELAASGQAGTVTRRQVGCLDRCKQAPNADGGEREYTRCAPGEAASIIARVSGRAAAGPGSVR